MTDDINALARIQYESGIDPIDFAEGEVTLAIRTHATVALSRATAPGTFPIYSPDLSLEALARRILGALLDAGWNAPVWPIPEPGPREA